MQDDASRRLGLWAPGLNPSDPGVPGFASLDSPFLRCDVEKSLAGVRPDSSVVIYADALKAFCAVRGLLDLGVSPGRILLVRPIAPQAATSGSLGRQLSSPGDYSPLSSTSWSLGDATVDIAAADVLAAAGVVDAGERFLEGVRLDAEGRVEAALFAEDVQEERQSPRPKSTSSRSEGRGGEYPAVDRAATSTAKDDNSEGVTASEEERAGVVIRCGLLLCGDTPNVDPDVFRAVNNSGLVYDGRLVVDPMFRTSDPTVLAGGTLTRFSRVHQYAEALRHERHNSSEVCRVRC